MDTEALVYTTSEAWIDFLSGAARVDLVNFWTKDLRGLRLASDAPFFFKRARSGSIVGYGRYRQKVRMTIAHAWNLYGVGNGAPSLEAKIQRARDVLGISQANVQTMIGCIELEEPEFFPREMWVPLKELGLGPSTAPQYVAGAIAERILERFEVGYEESIRNHQRVPGGVTRRTVRGRTFQRAFRKVQLENYGARCSMCDVSNQDFLVGSHIVRVADDLDSATDPANGLALCLTHDRAFEEGYIYLDAQLRIRLASSAETLKASPLWTFFDGLDRQHLRLAATYPPAKEYLARHRRRIGLG